MGTEGRSFLKKSSKPFYVWTFLGDINQRK